MSRWDAGAWVTVVVSSLIVIAWLVGDVARWWSRSKRGSDGKA